ncbi:MAG TPA: DUF4178 domain-containing protein, partial [Polyangiaceae bacterium]|nr:DUF4178 domain-containing protein [Polyangiaceae bacterium]
MSQGSPFDRQAPCPNCGAPMTFKLAGARAQVCKYCKFLVARTDRGLDSLGKVADLVEIPSPLSVGATGYWDRKRFEVVGRLQLDRVGAASAPWQEFLVTLVDTGENYWIAFAQGRWYATKEIKPAPPLPPLSSLRPGVPLQLPVAGSIVVGEVGQRKIISAEGELADVPVPGSVTPYADVAGSNGGFGTIDYGDGRTVLASFFYGSRIDPATFKLDSGQPLEAAKAEVTAVTCPGCGGSLPLVAPGTTERIVCKYCGAVSDVAKNGALSAMGRAPRPPAQPRIPLGAEGHLGGGRVICIGFVVRGTTVDGVRYHWREYLLYAGPTIGYLWLMEEDDAWKVVTPLSPGDVQVAGMHAIYRGASYGYKQSVSAQVEHVVGEFYWKVARGETVQATEYEGPGGIVSVEKDSNEVSISF